MINIKQIAKLIVGLGERVAPTNINVEKECALGEQTIHLHICHIRVTYIHDLRMDCNKYQIQFPLPPKIDASVTMM